MSYSMSLLERFHYMEEVLGAHLLHTKMQNLSEQWLSSAALIFERNIKIGAVMGTSINLWTGGEWNDYPGEREGKGYEKIEEDRMAMNWVEEMLYKSWNRKTGEQLKVCRLSGKCSLGGKLKCHSSVVYCGSLFLQGNNSHGCDCEGTKSWMWSGPLDRCWGSSENRVDELQG